MAVRFSRLAVGLSMLFSCNIFVRQAKLSSYLLQLADQEGPFFETFHPVQDNTGSNKRLNSKEYPYKIHYNPLERLDPLKLPAVDPSLHWTVSGLTKEYPVTIVFENSAGFGSYLHANALAYALFSKAKKYGIKAKVIFRSVRDSSVNASTAVNETQVVERIHECFPELYDFEIDESYNVKEPRKIQQKWLGDKLASHLHLKTRAQLGPESLDRTMRLLQQILLDKESYPPPDRIYKHVRVPFIRVSIPENYKLVTSMYDELEWMFKMDLDVCCPKTGLEPGGDETVLYLSDYKEEEELKYIEWVASESLPNSSDVSVVAPPKFSTSTYANLLRSSISSSGHQRKVRIINQMDDDDNRRNTGNSHTPNNSQRISEDFCFMAKADTLLVGPTGSHDYFWAATLGRASRIRFYNPTSSRKKAASRTTSATVGENHRNNDANVKLLW